MHCSILNVIKKDGTKSFEDIFIIEQNNLNPSLLKRKKSCPSILVKIVQQNYHSS